MLLALFSGIASTTTRIVLMNKIILDVALSQIKQACGDQKKKGRPSPFFFLVGAGISYPPVPLAGQIIEECKKVAEELGRGKHLSPIQSTDVIDVYSYWLQAAYPQRMQRQALFREHIEKKPISHANFRLAHLLLDKSIANLVVTPNFDDLLQRALTLFGRPPVVCDHPQTVERIYHEQDENDIRIVHVHGTYWFYDCCNLRGEVEGRAYSSSQATLTMETLLAKILADRSPLVIGYSGWEGDVIMNALKRHLLSRPSPYNLYWFSHRESEIEKLPLWLREHPDVIFVVPEDVPVQALAENNGATLDAKGLTEVAKQDDAGDLPNKEKTEPTLSAQKVFGEMIQAFKLKAPDLTADPLHFFADSLSSSLPQDNSEDAKGTPYFFGSVIDKLKQASSNESKVLNQLESLRDAVRRSEYPEALDVAAQIPIKTLAKLDLSELLSILFQSSSQYTAKAPEQSRLYKIVMDIADALIKQGYPDDLQLQKRLQWALACKAYYLGSEKKYDASVATCDDMIQRLLNNPDADLQNRLLWAMDTKARHFALLNRDEDSLKAYDELVKEFGSSTNITIQNSVAEALMSKAAKLNTLVRYQDAIDVYDDIIKRFESNTDTKLQEKIVTARANKAIVLAALQPASTITASESVAAAASTGTS